MTGPGARNVSGRGQRGDLAAIKPKKRPVSAPGELTRASHREITSAGQLASVLAFGQFFWALAGNVHRLYTAGGRTPMTGKTTNTFAQVPSVGQGHPLR